jgi:predicted  nucleic acid-binding Zn-ribbon protein
MDFIQNDQLLILVQIQEKDVRIAEIVEKQKNLPEVIKSLRASLDKSQQDLAEATRVYDVAIKAHKTFESSLKDTEARITKLKEKIPEIKTNKEYHALLKEITTIEQEKSDLEEKILILLEKLDELKVKRTEKEQVLKEDEKSFMKEKEIVEKDYNQLAEMLKELESHKSDIVVQMDSKLLAEYNRLMTAKKGLAVVSVQGEHCLGCHMRIPPQVFSEIKKNEKIIYCLNCKRILYWKPQNVVS